MLRDSRISLWSTIIIKLWLELTQRIMKEKNILKIHDDKKVYR